MSGSASKSKKNSNDNDQVSNRRDILQDIVNEINKEFGSQSVNIFTTKNINVDVISTGSLLIDEITGIGGIPRGRITEIYGSEGSGKTTLSLSLIKQCQDNGGICVFIDVEHALSAAYAKQLGINIEELIISQPNSGEEALEIVDKLLTSNNVDLIIVDSVAALTPESELKGEMTDASMGVKARMLSKGLGKIILKKHNTALVFINQVRSNIGVMFGNPNVTTGGKALKYYSSMRIEMSRKTLIKKNNNTTGQNVQVKIVKNKNANPFTDTEVQLLYGIGFSKYDEIVKIGLSKNIFTQKGAWYYYNDQQVCQGKDALTEKLEKDSEFKSEILNQII